MSKKKIALGVLGVLTLAIAGFCAYVATRPTSYTVVRSQVVSGTPEVVAPYLTDLRQWILWNPWDELEPTSIKEYSDPASGVGAWYTWAGEEVGSGRMEITAITPTRVDYALHFTAPMDDHAVVYMELAPQGEGRARVT
ncbi:MAG: SRPBCC family protein [Sandaracinaceae bacterium]|nr:SRPBCC family protein [Sandaracinaceae bacterium]